MKETLNGLFLPRLELHQLLSDLRAGQVLDSDLPVVLRCLGDGFFLGAMEELESGVRSATVEVRRAALGVLATRWQLPQHLSLFEFLLRHDGDGEIRALAARGLGAVLTGSRDRDALKLLAQLVTDGKEPAVVREAAYYAAFRLVDDVPESPIDVASFAPDDEASALRVSALLSDSAGVCPRCGRPMERAGDGPVWCLQCAIEMCDPAEDAGE